MSDSDKPMNRPTILGRYRELQMELNGFVQKVTELEESRNEHRLVEETLTPLDPSRRAFRLVGGVLVERTVGEVLPNVAQNRSNLEQVIDTLKTNLEGKQKETIQWKTMHDITKQEEQMIAQ